MPTFKHVELTRNEATPDGTFGILRVPSDGLLLYTCEDDYYRDGHKDPNGSAVPAGTYPLKRTIYYKHGYEAFEICDIPNYSRVLIHIGNTEEDSLACVLVGMRYGQLTVVDEDTGVRTNKRAVVESSKAFHKFMDAMSGCDVGQISITWSNGAP